MSEAIDDKQRGIENRGLISSQGDKEDQMRKNLWIKCSHLVIKRAPV